AARRHPPHPEQAEDMVDAHAACMPEQAAQHVAQGRVAELGETARVPWGHPPVLSLLVERVGWRTDARAQGEGVLQGPGVSTRRVGPDREVVHDTDRETMPARVVLHG